MIKLKIGNQTGWTEHRSGWNYVLNILATLDDESGILFDGNLDASFGYDAPVKRQRKVIPYSENWMGFIHSTANLCPFMTRYITLSDILSTEEFTRSLDNCMGIFTLSEDLAAFVAGKLNWRVNVTGLKHPTEFVSNLFNPDRFFADQKLLHIGNWLRRITPFFKVRARGYKKVMLLNPTTLSHFDDELNYHNETFDLDGVKMINHLGNEAYDQVLSESIVFINLCDSSATNTIVECIVRNTPILVNRLRSVEEYLGKEYPFYYSSLEEAERKMGDRALIKETFGYLKDFPGKKELDGRYFLESFLNSSVMQLATR